MKKTVAEKWVKALRSKKYKQGRSVLKKKDNKGVTRHCCLGVLCELYQQDRRAHGYRPLPVKSEDANYYRHGGAQVFSFDDEATTLPDPVRRWAGLNNSTGEFDTQERIGGELHYDLVSINDSGSTFKRIADVIEKHREEL